MIHVIPCGAKKAHTARPCPSSALDQGPYFQACRDWARSVAGDDDIRILSARHGFVGLDTWLEPYDTRFGREGSVSIDELVGKHSPGEQAPSFSSAASLTCAQRVTPSPRLVRSPTRVRAESGGAGIGHQNRLAAAKTRSPPPSDPHA